MDIAPILGAIRRRYPAPQVDPVRHRLFLPSLIRPEVEAENRG
jgi:hypothetical protein